ncbi:hypothetical protein VTK26DRAFT_7317 [Humicola hyalothermophila]
METAPPIHALTNLESLNALAAANKHLVVALLARCEAYEHEHVAAALFARLARDHAVEGRLAFARVRVDGDVDDDDEEEEEEEKDENMKGEGKGKGEARGGGEVARRFGIRSRDVGRLPAVFLLVDRGDVGEGVPASERLVVEAQAGDGELVMAGDGGDFDGGGDSGGGHGGGGNGTCSRGKRLVMIKGGDPKGWVGVVERLAAAVREEMAGVEQGEGVESETGAGTEKDPETTSSTQGEERRRVRFDENVQEIPKVERPKRRGWGKRDGCKVQ